MKGDLTARSRACGGDRIGQPARSGIFRVGLDPRGALRAAGESPRRRPPAADAALTYEPDYAAALLARGRILLAEKQPIRRTESAHARGETSTRYPNINGSSPMRCGRRAVRLTPRPSSASSSRAARPAIRARSRSTSRLAARTRSTALSLAEAELGVRADVFTLDAHAWALAANGRTAEARPSSRARLPKARRTPGCSCTPASFMRPPASRAKPHAGSARRTASARCSCRRKRTLLTRQLDDHPQRTRRTT